MDALDPIQWEITEFSTELLKLPSGTFKAVTTINGKTLTAEGPTERDASLALEERVEQATVTGEVSFGG